MDIRDRTELHPSQQNAHGSTRGSQNAAGNFNVEPYADPWVNFTGSEVWRDLRGPWEYEGTDGLPDLDVIPGMMQVQQRPGDEIRKRHKQTAHADSRAVGHTIVRIATRQAPRPRATPSRTEIEDARTMRRASASTAHGKGRLTPKERYQQMAWDAREQFLREPAAGGFTLGSDAADYSAQFAGYTPGTVGHSAPIAFARTSHASPATLHNTKPIASSDGHDTSDHSDHNPPRAYAPDDTNVHTILPDAPLTIRPEQAAVLETTDPRLPVRQSDVPSGNHPTLMTAFARRRRAGEAQAKAAAENVPSSTLYAISEAEAWPTPPTFVWVHAVPSNQNPPASPDQPLLQLELKPDAGMPQQPKQRDQHGVQPDFASHHWRAPSLREGLRRTGSLRLRTDISYTYGAHNPALPNSTDSQADVAHRPLLRVRRRDQERFNLLLRCMRCLNEQADNGRAAHGVDIITALRREIERQAVLDELEYIMRYSIPLHHRFANTLWRTASAGESQLRRTASLLALAARLVRAATHHEPGKRTHIQPIARQAIIHAARPSSSAGEGWLPPSPLPVTVAYPYVPPAADVSIKGSEPPTPVVSNQLGSLPVLDGVELARDADILDQIARAQISKIAKGARSYLETLNAVHGFSTSA